MRIKKIEYNNDTFKINLQKVVEGGQNDTVKLKLHEDPKPGFKAALTKLKKFLILYCEMESHDPKHISVIGIELTYSGETNSRSVSILGERKYTKTEGKQDLETPVKMMDIGDGDNTEFALDPDCVKLVDKLCKEAREYMKGTRLQKDIFELSD